MLGYFAFPPPGFGPSLPVSTNDESQESAANVESLPDAQDIDALWEERQRQAAEARRRRLEQQRAVALEGELYWVSMGGSIRDVYGRKDKARTEELRAEVRIRNEERKLLDRWDAYETRWRAMMASPTPIAFNDIPWPVDPHPSSVDDLSSDAVAEFLFAPLRVRANTISKKDHIRMSLLRWHPDKLSAVVARTIEEDADSVRAAINAVFCVLRALQAAERNPQAQEEK
ncbi:hypothetical protein L226DRAFT_530813 [Lentinus tigrinus ALCF2SS1-7]|uniref:J domain-containing protein n=1 Tax=Lentinus tigrinus ALCF2SS1-6 TaxID=1328759 RepID=A0A5C2SQL3_9APHY|nr:hypothetical protein L227DRAFT_570939 [Lentinus tigrinus ALCF2SS1-6]RPD78948.1 hypothetical protein L226DRAFT_530813 [Lentinus tigrinus ALCF2SS1-7]